MCKVKPKEEMKKTTDRNNFWEVKRENHLKLCLCGCGIHTSIFTTFKAVPRH